MKTKTGKNKSVGDKTGQNRRYYEKHKEAINARNKRNYQINKNVILERLSEAKKTIKGRAREQVRTALRCGKLIRSDKCDCCGLVAVNIHAHHEDYSRPLDVVWLCTKCHGIRHSNDGIPISMQ